MLNIVLFGPPGAGKGTQSKKLIDEFHLIHLSTGDILRSEIAAGTKLGLEAKQLMDKGILVPDEVVIGMIRNKLQKNSEAGGFIFDGFPRTVAQAIALDKLLEEQGTEIHQMLALEVGEAELTQRLLKRAALEGRTDDANESVIKKRIDEYNNKTAPVANYYKKHNKLSSVRGEGSVDEIFSLLSKAIEKVSC